MKPVDVNLSTYIDLNKENNKEDPKFKAGDQVRILKYKKYFCNKRLRSKTNQTELRKIKRKVNKLYIKWKGYHNFFNGWVSKKYIVI